MTVIQKALERFPRLSMSVLPTPLHKLEKISEACGANIYCKRDDLTGFGMGGNKTRKLDFLIADALEQGANTVVTAGANQSNFCRMAAAACAANGIEAHLILGGAEPETPTGNLLLDHLFGAVIHHVDSKNWDDWESESQRLASELTTSGRTVLRLPVGGSVPVGSLGYVSALDEIIIQSEQMGIQFDAIIHATSSAGTQAGLDVGKALSGWNGSIIGMAVAKNKEQLEDEVYTLAGQAADLIGEVTVSRDSITVDDSYLGDDYAARTECSAEAIEMFAKLEGIILDHVYSGKSAAGLIDYARTQKLGSEANFLYIHTGGNIELFE